MPLLDTLLAVASKYDAYWLSKVDALRTAITEAAAGMPSTMPLPDLAELGERSSWYGTATVRGGDVLQGSMAHVVALARMVAARRLCPLDGSIFRFTVGADLVLTVRRESSPLPLAHQPRIESPPRPTGGIRQASARVATAEAMCAEVHRLLQSLPSFDGPDKIPFNDGLYFFYEHGETTTHTHGPRVVRVGNHPRSAGRLRQRLRDHYRASRGAKNGSVFRRYIGGALLRRGNPISSCLAPGPGLGHWERQNEPACPLCESLEEAVSSTLRETFTLRAVCISDISERNRLEALLIATIAACSVCRPSGSWLGQFAYPERVHQAGLWNTEFVGGPLMTRSDLNRFKELVQATANGLPERAELARTLLVIPCSGAKKGTRTLGLPTAWVWHFIDEPSRRLLEDGRDRAFQRPGTHLDLRSPQRPGLEYYSGQPYKTPGVTNRLVGAIGAGLHCLIVSGGYGVVRAEEPIHSYNAHLGTQTRSIWSSRLPQILRSYVERQGIKTSYVLLSTQYAACVPRLTNDEYRYVPQFVRGRDSGSPIQVVPTKIGEELHRVLGTLAPALD